MIKDVTIPVLVLFLAFVANANSQDVVGKTTCGYQGWFNCYGDGSDVDSWRHWAVGDFGNPMPDPAPGYVDIDLYPDLSVYPTGDLFATSLGNHGDGSNSKLFSSYNISTINVHFDLMKKHGIDGIALQRHINEVLFQPFKVNRDTISQRVERAATRTGRTFYFMYDLTGLPGSAIDSIKTDWTNTILQELNLTNSSAYAIQDNKPVVCLWGLGFPHVNGTLTQHLELIQWFKNQGYFVIGGTPTYWRQGINDSKSGWQSVYNSFDMISPWSVGRFETIPEADDYQNMLRLDKALCDLNGIYYQPVIWPGFSWHNLQGGPQNQVKREQGEFMWTQAINAMEEGVESLYVAMFDEYDESTAIAPAADSYFDIPASNYFLTTSADGQYVSSDFYLRLTGEITKLLKDEISMTPQHKVSFGSAPIYFRTSVEPGFDAMPNFDSEPDESAGFLNVLGIDQTGNPICTLIDSVGQLGDHSILIQGFDNDPTASFAYFKVFDVDIPVFSDSYISYKINPQSILGQSIGLDLLMTDGSNLRDVSAVSTNGIGMHPGNPKGPVNAWTEINCNIGQWTAGKTIDRIMIAFDQGANTGEFKAFLDDIIIERICPANYTGSNQLTGDQNYDESFMTDGVISSNQLIESPVEVSYHSGVCIELLDNFEVEIGSIFQATLDGCLY